MAVAPGTALPAAFRHISEPAKIRVEAATGSENCTPSRRLVLRSLVRAMTQASFAALNCSAVRPIELHTANSSWVRPVFSSATGGLPSVWLRVSAAIGAAVAR
ncbi:hypothetical protein D3C84_1066760 [compost metagenome]